MRRLLALLIALLSSTLAGWLVLGASGAHANRFGPPWQGRVVLDTALVYSQPDLSAQVLGPLGRGAIVAVTGEQSDSAGHEWTATNLGFVPSENVVEYTESWIAEVRVPSTPVYAKPNARDAIRLDAKQGDLLRVAGVSPGLNGICGGQRPKATWPSTMSLRVKTRGRRCGTCPMDS
jgi:hypothetical protein